MYPQKSVQQQIQPLKSLNGTTHGLGKFSINQILRMEVKNQGI